MCLSLLEWNITSIVLQFWSGIDLEFQNITHFRTFWKHSIKCGLEYVFLKDVKLGAENLYENSCLLVSQKFHATFTFQAYLKFSNWKQRKKNAHVE